MFAKCRSRSHCYVTYKKQSPGCTILCSALVLALSCAGDQRQSDCAQNYHTTSHRALANPLHVFAVLFLTGVGAAVGLPRDLRRQGV